MNFSTNWIYRKKHLEDKGLRVKMVKAKIMICDKNLHLLKDAGKHPCGVCRKWVIQSSVMDVNLGYIRNVVVLKVDGKLFPNM